MGDLEIYEMSDACLEDYCYSLDKLDETIRHGINNLIYEEKGVNETVRYNCFILFNQILEHAKNTERVKIENFYGVFKRKGSFRFKMDISPNEIIDIKVPKEKILISYTFYNFKDKQCKDIFDKNDHNHTYGCECNCNGMGYLNIIVLNFYMISGHADISKWADSIQHELSHDFEITNRGKPYINDLNKIGLKLMSSNDVCVKSIGYILYASDKTEIRAYANGLYAYLSSKNIIMPKYTNLRHSDFFKILKELNNSLAFIKDNKNNKELLEKINLYLEKYHINYDKLIEIGENTIKKWNKEAMRTINKYTKDAQIKFDYWTDAPLPRFI
jgi:hypothetical protein